MVLPEKQISLVAGIMQAFQAFFAVYHLTWILPLDRLNFSDRRHGQRQQLDYCAYPRIDAGC